MTMMTAIQYKPPVPARRLIGTGTANPRNFGAKGDGKNDDTSAFQKAIDSIKTTGGTLTVDAGTYLLDPTIGVKFISKFWFKAHVRARFIAKANDANRYGMFRINGLSEVLFSGGLCFGDRDTHTYKDYGSAALNTHEWGHCFQVFGSKKITVRDVLVEGFTGDALSMASSNQTPDPGEEQADDIHIENMIGVNNRRQGISVGKATNVLISYCSLAKTNGTSPECGIDVEPESGGITRNVHIYRCNLNGNAKNGVEILKRSAVNTPLSEVYVVECNLTENVIGGQTTSVNGVAFYRNHVRHNSATGIRLNADTNDCHITDNLFANNYDQGGEGTDRDDYIRTGAGTAQEKDILIRNDPAQNDIGVNRYE